MLHRLILFSLISLIVNFSIYSKCTLPKDPSGVEQPDSICAHLERLIARHNLERALLLHGPSGSGKTDTAIKIATSADLSYKVIDTPGLVGKYAGEASKKIKDEFEDAYKTAQQTGKNVVLIFDEADALMVHNTQENAQNNSQQVAGMLEFCLMRDRYASKNGKAGVDCILTTRNPKAIDWKVIRRSIIVEIKLPDTQKRTVFTNYMIKDKRLENIIPAADIKKIVSNTDQMDLGTIEYIISDLDFRVNVSGEKYQYSMVTECLKLIKDQKKQALLR